MAAMPVMQPNRPLRRPMNLRSRSYSMAKQLDQRAEPLDQVVGADRAEAGLVLKVPLGVLQQFGVDDGVGIHADHQVILG